MTRHEVVGFRGATGGVAVYCPPCTTTYFGGWARAVMPKRSSAARNPPEQSACQGSLPNRDNGDPSFASVGMTSHPVIPSTARNPPKSLPTLTVAPNRLNSDPSLRSGGQTGLGGVGRVQAVDRPFVCDAGVHRKGRARNPTCENVGFVLGFGGRMGGHALVNFTPPQHNLRFDTRGCA